MHAERWKDLLDNIRENFEVEEFDNYFLPEEHGGTEVEYIVFDSHLGLIKLEFITKPKIIDRKTVYSNRIGSEVDIDYVYSDTEKTHELLVYRWGNSEEEWLPFENNGIF